MLGVGGCCASLIVEAAIVASYASPVPSVPNKAGLGLGVAAFYVFVIFYGLGIDSAGTVFYSEIFPNHIRARGLALATMTIALTDLVSSLWYPLLKSFDNTDRCICKSLFQRLPISDGNTSWSSLLYPAWV